MFQTFENTATYIHNTLQIRIMVFIDIHDILHVLKYPNINLRILFDHYLKIIHNN